MKSFFLPKFASAIALLGIALLPSLVLFAQTTQIQDPPEGTVDGLNILSANSAVFRLRAPGKDHVHLRGDFNNFAVNDGSLMFRSEDGNTYWKQMNNLLPSNWYRYHYLIDDTLEVGDPYTEVVLDQWEDQYIPWDHWPYLPTYPSGQASWQQAAFQTNPTPFAWTDEDYQRPAQDRLFIYEVLIRDFDGGQTYQDVIDRLDYLEWLGVTAIELMPVSEFEGNSSWGYNPTFRFAADKFYGTKQKLQTLVNACHNRGIAVILDIVPNHGFGQDPLARKYLDPDGSIAPNNPWFNEVAMHPFSPGYDYNHWDPWTQEFWKRVFDYWIDEYHIDGYRIDLSKGLTQTNSGGDVGAWNQFDQGRVDLLFNYGNHIWSNHPGTFIILEHLGNNDEETVLANGGFMLWGKMTFNFAQATMGWGGDLSFGLHTSRGWSFPNLVTYFESHDEERLAHDVLTFGAENGDYDVKNFSTAMERVAMAHAFLLSMPGPKMTWQWSEMGYDVSIFDCLNGTFNESCKLGEKPERWWYLDDPDRRAAVKKTAAVAQLKKSQPAFNGWDFNADLWGELKRIRLYNPDQNVIVIGNFGTSGLSMPPGFPYAGTWYDHFTGEEIVENDLNNPWYFAPGELRILMDTPLPTPDLDGSTPLAINGGCTDVEANNYDPSAEINDGSCLYTVTLSVAFDGLPADPHVAGSFQGWDPGTTPLMENGTIGAYETTLEMAVGNTIEYKFLNGNAWGTDESVPSACGVSNGSGGFNRSFVLGADLVSPPTVCFSTCAPCLENPDDAGCTDSLANNYDSGASEDDGSCTYDVTLAVDAAELEVAPEGMHVAGDFQGWSPASTPLALDTGSVWWTTISMSLGQTIAYKFINGNAWGLDEIVPVACGSGTDVLNRVFVLDANLESPTIPCFGECSSCTQPPLPADGSDYCGPGTYWDANAQKCLPDSTNSLCVEDINADGSVGVNDLLQLLGAFGDLCEE